MKKILSRILVSCLLVSASSVLADNNKGGFSLGSTRVIFKENEQSATLSVNNSAKDSPFLAQSWLTSYSKDEKKPPFIITPPLYRQDFGKNTLRIIKTNDDLPKDRESAFWLNVKAIPAERGDAQNSAKISFAYVLRIKMFYRPSALIGEANNAYKELSFAQKGNKLVVKNTTPYFVTLNKVMVDGVDVENVSDMVPPLSHEEYILPSSKLIKKVEYKSINDMGGLTPGIVKSVAE
ncbi:fimbria/pilus periplasmic chaperone [Enterobacteriaceae bacterium RIT692]|nr:fimbria/pilus periplasmic chaperone [Enterobacteriaceae bacterium RIT692]